MNLKGLGYPRKKGRTKMIVNIKKLNDTAIIPTRQHDGDAGYDLYSNVKDIVTIPPHETRKIGTGIAVEIPDGYFGAIFARSGIATKNGLRPANCTGVADSQYRGEYMVALHNDTDSIQTVKYGERIAQLVIIPYLNAEFSIVGELPDTDRGDGGFGSTGR